MKRKEVTADVWLAHRKERKKVASAKWYAAKKKAEINEQNAKRRELEAQYQAKKAQYLWSDEERASWRCVLDNLCRQWPCRPHHIKALDWCIMMDLTEECVQRMNIDWTGRSDELKLVRHMCMREFRECYESVCGGKGLERIRERIRDRSSAVDQLSVPTIASHSSWDSIARVLTGGWFPVICTGVGLLFLQLSVLGQLRHWPGLVHHMYNVQATTTARDQQNGDNPPQTSPPVQNPMHNPCLNDPGIQDILAALTRTEKDLQEEVWSDDTPSSSSHRSYFSCSLPSSLDSLWEDDTSQRTRADYHDRQSQQPVP